MVQGIRSCEICCPRGRSSQNRWRGLGPTPTKPFRFCSPCVITARHSSSLLDCCTNQWTLERRKNRSVSEPQPCYVFRVATERSRLLLFSGSEAFCYGRLALGIYHSAQPLGVALASGCAMNLSKNPLLDPPQPIVVLRRETLNYWKPDFPELENTITTHWALYFCQYYHYVACCASFADHFVLTSVQRELHLLIL